MFQIICEFDRVIKRDAAELFSKFWTEDRVTKVVELAKKKKTAAALVRK